MFAGKVCHQVPNRARTSTSLQCFDFDLHGHFEIHHVPSVNVIGKGRPFCDGISVFVAVLGFGVDARFLFRGTAHFAEDPNSAEEDGMDETICPCDFQSAGMLVDDEMFDALVAPLHP